MNIFKTSLSKLAILGVFAIVIPMLIAFSWSYYWNKEKLEKRILGDLTFIADAYEGQIYLFLHNLSKRAEDFASDGLIKTQILRKIRGRESAAGILNKHLIKNKITLDHSIETINILSLDGKVIASTNSDEIGMDLSGETFFIKGKEATTTTTTTTTTIINCAAHSGIPELVISTPIFNNRGDKPIGVLVNFVRISMLNEILSGEYVFKMTAIPQINKEKWNTLEIYLVNQDKLMISESLFVKDAVLKQAVNTMPVELGLTSNGEMAGFYKNYRDVEVLGVSMVIPSLKWVLLVEVDKDEVHAPVRRILINTLIMAVVFAGLVALLFVVFLKEIIRPLGAISRATKEIISGNFDVVIPVAGGDEIGILCESFNTMSRNLKNRINDYLRLTRVLDATSDFVGIADLEGKALYLNTAARRMLDLETDKIDANFRISGIHSQWADTLLPKKGVSFAVQYGVWEGETTFLTQSGREITVSQVIIAHKDSSGDVHYLSTIARNITERKYAEELLRKSEDKYRTLLESLPQKIFYKDMYLTYITCNEHFARDLKLQPAEIEGKTDYDFFPEELAEKYRADDRRIMKSGHTEELEERYVADGREMIVRTVKTPVKDNKGNVTGVLGIFWDITEFKQAKAERLKLEEQLYHMQKLDSIGTLAGGIAHDFNNILALIMGYGSLLEKELEKDSPLKSYVQKILESSERAANLTHGLLTFSRKHQATNQTPTSVNEIIRIMEGFVPRILHENISFKTVLTDKDCVIMANANQIEQALMNLVTNAIHAMPDGGSLTLSTDVVVFDDENENAHNHHDAGAYALISVADTGMGMNEKTLTRIFEPFFTTKEVGKGTGLGLAIVYGIIKQHKGFIDVQSTTGSGATFRVYIPIIESKIEEIKEMAHEAVSYPVSGKETILVAEDEAKVLELTETIFEEQGYKVIKASDGEDAIDKFRKNKEEIKLLVLDVRMPRKNGKEAYDAIKKIKPDIKVLFMSGYNRDIINNKEIVAEGSRFVLKPVIPQELLRKARNILDDENAMNDS